MSATATTDPGVAVNGNSGQADGSPQSGTDHTKETTEGSEIAEGVEPEANESGEKDSSAQELAKQQAREQELEELAYLRSVVNGINEDPEILKFVQERMNGGKQADPIEEAANMFAAIDKDSETPGAWKNAMQKALRAAAEAGAKQALAQIEPRLGTLGNAVNGNLFEQALLEGGLTLEEIKSPAFKAKIKELRTDDMFRAGQTKRPKSAARMAIAEWKLSAQSRSVNQAERARIERVKGANHLNGTNPRASATAPKKFIYDPNDPNLLSKRSAWMEANPGASPQDFVNIRKQRT